VGVTLLWYQDTRATEVYMKTSVHDSVVKFRVNEALLARAASRAHSDGMPSRLTGGNRLCRRLATENRNRIEPSLLEKSRGNASRRDRERVRGRSNPWISKGDGHRRVSRASASRQVPPKP
jgi:hypothetical protein